MPKTIFVDTAPDTGHDAASGLDQKRPKRTLQAALAAADRNATILVRMGSEFTVPQILRSNGLHYGVYALGTETNQPPTVRLPRGAAKTTGLLIEGSDNHLSGWDVDGADIGVDVASASKDHKTFYTGNHIEGVRVHRYAWAYRIRASGTVAKACAAFQGRMYRDGDKTATGANAFTLWADEGLVLSDVTLTDCYSEDAWAYSSGLTQKPDGSAVEGWGSLENIRVFGMISRSSGTFFEIGGRVKRADGTPANEYVRGVIFERCLVVDPMGRVFYANARKGDFPIEFEGVEFLYCTAKADDDKTSPFYIGKDHGSLKDKLRVDHCVIVGAAQFYNADDGTSLDIDHANNHYWRSDGGKGFGGVMHPSETVGDPQFVDAKAGDFRRRADVTQNPDAGALGRALPAARTGKPGSGTSQSTAPREVWRWSEMTAIPVEQRTTCYVRNIGQTFVWNADLKTWLKA